MLRKLAMQRKILDSTFIFLPASNCEYVLKTNCSQYPIVTASFTLGAEDYLYFELETSIHLNKNSLEQKAFNINHPLLVPPHALPFHVIEQPRSPLMIFNQSTPEFIYGITNLRITLGDKHSFKYDKLQTFPIIRANAFLCGNACMSLKECEF